MGAADITVRTLTVWLKRNGKVRRERRRGNHRRRGSYARRAMQTEGWSRFPRSILRLTPKRDVAGRSATAYLKHLLDLVPSSS
jgi:hypothetical protein